MPTDMAMAPTAAPTAGYPITIQNCGRTLTFSKAPERIVTTYPNAAELLIRLGVGDKIVGSMYHKDTPVTAEVAEAFNRIPTQFDKYPSKEELVTLNADFALATYDSFDFSGQNSMPTVEEAASLGLPVYGISTECGGGVKTSVALSMIYDDVLNLGKIFGAQARAQEIVDEMRGRIDAVQQAVAGKPTLSATIYYGGEGPLGVFTNGIYADLLKLAGGKTVFPNEKQNSAEISVEAFAAANPDVIFALEYGTPFEEMRAYLRKTFPNISAVKNDRIVLVDSGTFPPGYRNIEAVEAFARGLHPDAFASASTTAYPITIQNCGSTLTFTKAPERVLVTYQNVAEILVKLGLKDKIVGVTYGQAYPAPVDMQAEIDGLNYLSPPRKGSAAKEVELSTRPDFVIAAYPTYDFDPAQGVATQDDFRATGAQIYGVSAECQQSVPSGTINTVYSDILNFGAIFGVPERAQALVTEMQDRIAVVQARVATLPPVVVAFYDAGEDQLGFYGSGLNSDMIALAGGTNVFADQTDTYLQVSKEAFAVKSPAIFAVLDYEGAPEVPDEAKRAEFLFTTFPNMPASRDKRWVAVPGSAFAASIRIPEAIEVMAKAFHPEAFK